MSGKVQKYSRITAAGLAVYVIAVWLKIDNRLPVNMEFGWFFAAYLLSGYSIFRNIADNFAKKIFLDGNVLLIIATVGLFTIGHYGEAALIILIFQIGNTLDMITANRSKRKIRELVDVHAVFAHKKVNGQEIQVEPFELAERDVIVVRPGERIPVDGRVIFGTTSLDTQMLTGEVIPRDVDIGSKVYSGSMNLTGAIEVEVLHTYEDSTVSKILNIVDSVEEKRPGSESKTIRHVRNYVLVILAVAAVMVWFPQIAGKKYAGFGGVEHAVIFLVAACPSAIGISVSAAFLGGILSAAKKGIIVKGGAYLEELSRANTFLFDKTGTLTEGAFEVQEISAVGMLQSELLEIATYLESYSNHPIAVSLKKAYGRDLEYNCMDELEEIPGYGLKATYKGRQVYLGNARLLKEKGVVFQEVHKAGSVIYVAVAGKYAGYIVISDTIKKDVREMLAYLKKRCQAVTVMVTGDTQFTGREVAEKLELDYYYANQLPEDKLKRLEEFMGMQDDTERLAAVGDGINDAPVLAKADVGIAMGALGSDAAIEAADIVLMDDEPMALVDAVRIAKETMKVIRQNMIYAMVVKLIVLALALCGMITVRNAVGVEVGVIAVCIFNAAWASKDPA